MEHPTHPSTVPYQRFLEILCHPQPHRPAQRSGHSLPGVRIASEPYRPLGTASVPMEDDRGIIDKRLSV